MENCGLLCMMSLLRKILQKTHLKYLLITLFLCSSVLLQAQKLVMHEDTVYQFKIAAPADWQTLTSKQMPNLKFISRNPVIAPNEKFHENYNVNIFKQPHLTLSDAVDSLLKYNSQYGDYKLIERGERNSKKCNFKWLLSSHTNELNNELMYNYTFVAYKDPGVYIITFSTSPRLFSQNKELFERIADTFEITE
jgi:hypothetical protein